MAPSALELYIYSNTEDQYVHTVMVEQVISRVNASQNEYVCSFCFDRVQIRLPNGETRIVGIIKQGNAWSHLQDQEGVSYCHNN